MRPLDRHPPVEATESLSDAETSIRETKHRERRGRIGLALELVLVVGVVARDCRYSYGGLDAEVSNTGEIAMVQLSV